MFGIKNRSMDRDLSARLVAVAAVEGLEGRRLLHGFGGGHGLASASILFSQAPTAVQTGLTTLATTDNLTAPTASQKVALGNKNGVETYTITESTTGVTSLLTVDSTGKAYNAPVTTTTTFGAITTAAVTAEINAIATALGLTAPTSTTSVKVTTPSTGTATYAVSLTSSTATGRHARATAVTVDAAGYPVGNQSLPFSVLPAALQASINANLPTGSTAITSTSTQNVNVGTANGVTTYTVSLSSTGTTTKVTVNAAGVLASLPSRSTSTFSAAPAAVQTALQTLATSKGVTTTIATTQNVSVYDEGNGTVIYTVTLGSGTHARNVTLSVDQLGNATTEPQSEGDGFGGRFGRFGFFGGPPPFARGECIGDGDSSDSSGTSAGTSTGTSTSSGSSSSSSSSNATTASTTAVSAADTSTSAGTGSTQYGRGSRGEQFGRFGRRGR